ncbi:MAG: AzlC family ABC transporter permease [Caulobacteraceae bacterium]
MENSSKFKEGIKAGIPVAIGYVPIAIAFGVLSKSSGIPNLVAMLMSLIIYAGASQFVGIKLMSLGISPFGIVLTTFILNLRHLLMTSYVSQKLQNDTPKELLPLLAFGVTDETFAVASIQKKGEIQPYFMLGLNLMAFSFWNIGTMIGLFMSSWIPEVIINSMGIALYSMFIGLIVPSMRTARPVLYVATASMAINSLFYFVPLLKVVSPSWGIIISTITASLMGSLLDAKEEQVYE